MRAELESAGTDFAPARTRKRFFAAFFEWDTDCFSRLRGMFADRAVDGISRRLVLARDRVGIKPLYIARHGEDLSSAPN